jgi:hypothetical protein
MSTAGFADVLSTINGRILPSSPSLASDLLFESFGFDFSKLDLKLLKSFLPLAPLHRVPGFLHFFFHAGQPPSAFSRWICLVLLAFVCLNFISITVCPCPSG